MVKAGFTRKRFKNHFDYMGWFYLLLPIVMVLVWSLLYTFTAYRAPSEKVLSFYLVGNMAGEAGMETLQEEVVPDFPTMEEFDFVNMAIADVTDYNSMQRVSTMIYAQQGDVYLMDTDLFEQFVTQGALLPLDGLIDTDIDLTAGTMVTQDDPVPRVYGIPTDSLYGLLSIEGYDMRNTRIGVMAFTTNPDESFQFVQWLLDHRAGEKPENFSNFQPKRPFYPEGFWEEMEEMEGGTP